jgi:ubiquinone/menaquinone biosynthesis C-methylase UbiE
VRHSKRYAQVSGSVYRRAPPKAARFVRLAGGEPSHEPTIDLLDINPSHHVLEIGFGGGSGIAQLAKRLTTGVVSGVDLSPDLVRSAQRRFRPEIAAGRVSLQFGDVSHLPFSEAVFDRVFTINTIYFWPDPEQGMAEIYRVLKPGGKAAVSIRSREKMEQHSVTKYNFRLFSGSDVADLMRQAGFRDVQIDHRDQDHWYDQVIVLGNR